MTLYYLDESRAPRECPCHCHREVTAEYDQKLCQCNGTGRLGVEGVEPDVNVFWWGGSADEKRGLYYVERPFDRNPTFGPFPTEVAALAAARASKHEENASG